MSAPKRIAANDAVAVAELGDETVLLNVETGVYFGLDEVGTRIWQVLGTATTEDEIFRKLLTEYDVEPAALRSDIEGFLANLAVKGLIREVAG